MTDNPVIPARKAELCINEFCKFYDLLMQQAPAGYIPHFFRCKPNDKIIATEGSWLSAEARLTKNQCISAIRQGYNIGLAALNGDPLIIFDIDNPALLNQLPPNTLTATSRSGGAHGFGWDKDGTAKRNLPTGKGELRSCNQYVLACGSYVPFDLAKPKDQKKWAEMSDESKTSPLLCHYTLRDAYTPRPLAFSDLPQFYQDEEARNTEVESKILQNEEAKTYPRGGKYDQLFALKASDVVGSIPPNKRVGHPYHDSATDANFSMSSDGTLAHCWRCMVSLNAVQLLCIKSGYAECRDAGTPHKGRGISKIRGDKKALENAYNEAIKMGIIRENKQTTETPEPTTEQPERKEKATSRYSFDNNIDYEISENETEIGEGKAPLNFGKFISLLTDTSHLPIYQEFETELALQGAEYAPLKKAIWYYLQSIKQPTNVIMINPRIKTDNRIHILLIIPSGRGKSTIKNFIKRVADKHDLIEPNISSVEQLIGKMVVKGIGKSKHIEPCFGVAHYKVVISDEAQNQINEEKEPYISCQKVKRIAMDCYGENEISKKLVNDTPEQILTYHSPSRFFETMHPVKLQSKFFDTGSHRRYEIFLVETNAEIDADAVTQINTEAPTQEEKVFSELINEYYAKRPVHNVPSFNADVLSIVSYFHKCLLVFLLKHKNKNALRYGAMLSHSLRIPFLKHIAVLATCKNEISVSVDTAINGCRDALLTILESIKSIDAKGNMALSSDVWEGLTENDAEACEFLLLKGAVSEESSNISIKYFWSVLAALYGCKPTQSRAHYYRLKRDGFIYSRKGQHESKVWLRFIPKTLRVINDTLTPPDVLRQRGFPECQTEKGVLALSSVVFVSENPKKSQSVGSAGDATPIRCVDLKNLIINNNNNIIDTPHTTDTLGTLENKQKVIDENAALSSVLNTQKGTDTLETKSQTNIQNDAFGNVGNLKHTPSNVESNSDASVQQPLKLYDRVALFFEQCQRNKIKVKWPVLEQEFKDASLSGELDKVVTLLREAGTIGENPRGVFWLC